MRRNPLAALINRQKNVLPPDQIRNSVSFDAALITGKLPLKRWQRIGAIFLGAVFCIVGVGELAVAIQWLRAGDVSQILYICFGLVAVYFGIRIIVNAVFPSYKKPS